MRPTWRMLLVAAVEAGALLWGVALQAAPASVYACPSGAQADGVDVASYQGVIDWNAAAASGVSFGYARAAAGTELDPTFQRNYAGMRSAGVVPGAYLFFEPGRDPVAQADELVRALAQAGYRPGDLIPALVVEATDGLSPQAMAASLHTAVDAIAGALGTPPVIATAPGVWQSLMLASRGFGYDPLWVENYGGLCPSLPDGWNSWSAWQYADNGAVAGIASAVDLDHAPAGRLPLDKPQTAAVAVTAAPLETTYDTSVTFTARVTATDASGTVTFWDPQGSEGGCVNLPLLAGQAICTIAGIDLGTTTIRASYSGNATTNAALAGIAVTVDPAPTTLAYIGPGAAVAGEPTTLTVRLTANGEPVPYMPVNVTAGGTECLTGVGTGGPKGVVPGSAPTTDANGVASCTLKAPATLGPTDIRVSFAGDTDYQPSTTVATLVSFAFPAAGAFAIGNLAGASVTWWGASWWRANPLSAGHAPASFKGFTDTPPSCGATWTETAGTTPPTTVPAYMGVVVTDSVTQTHNIQSGNVTHIVVVATDPGYSNEPSDAGTGTVVATYC